MNNNNKTIIFCLIILCSILFGFAIKEPEVVIEKTEPEIIRETVEVEVEKEPELYYNITSVEREMLARVVEREGGGEPIECQWGIVSVIFNRWESTGRSCSLYDIVYAEGQFDVASILYRTTPTEKDYESVDYVLKNGPTMPSWVQSFRANHYHNWNGYTKYEHIGNTYFGGFAT